MTVMAMLRIAMSVHSGHELLSRLSEDMILEAVVLKPAQLIFAIILSSFFESKIPVPYPGKFRFS